MSRIIGGLCIIAVGTVLMCTALKGQTYYHDDIGEVNSYAGAGFGQLGTHGWVGAASGAQFEKYFRGYIDASYLPLGSRTLRTYDGPVTTSRLFDINFTLHVQVPTHHRWTPYGLVGSALLLNTYRVPKLYSDGTIHYHGIRESRFGFEVGGGARVYLGEVWGVKGEYRYTVSTLNFSRILGGVFYEFHGAIPFLPRGVRRSVQNPL